MSSKAAQIKSKTQQPIHQAHLHQPGCGRPLAGDTHENRPPSNTKSLARAQRTQHPHHLLMRTQPCSNHAPTKIQPRSNQDPTRASEDPTRVSWSIPHFCHKRLLDCRLCNQSPKNLIQPFWEESSLPHTNNTNNTQLLGCWLVAYFLKKLKSSSLVLFCRLLHNLNPTPTQAPNTTTPHTNQQQPHSNQQQPRYPTKGI